MKHLLILASIAVLTMGAAACTREKPAETPPSVAAQDLTPIPGTPGAATSVTPPTPVPTDTPVVTSTVTIPPTTAPAPVPTSAPVASSTPVTPVAPAPPISAPGTYTVQWGDTLTKIALKFGVTTQAIVAANPGLNPNYIVPGQTIVIPAPGGPAAPSPTAGPGLVQPPSAGCTPTYTVQRGDWIYAIARRFGISVAALLAANSGTNPNILYPGQVLNIPCGSSSVPSGGNPSPGGRSYVVRPGETLFAIALRFGTTIYAIQIANNLPNPNFIYPGQVLVIPR